ncbi:MAG: hypothetical protein BRD55_00670 [Bacteroidetes bacterium SW_9_63_38]|nr:MAG: hypothetical protein BRD55_00670 [Bacteroidetes bacterium SW_9_63_38]
MTRDRSNPRRRQMWSGMLVLTSGLLALALSPPLLSPTWRAAVMTVFDPVCHQIPVRSPLLGGVQVAVCDRCVGIYVGIVLGIASAGWGQRVWKKLNHHVRYVMLGSLVPLGVDWIGPMLGLWTNIPESRALTGMVFGTVVASFTGDQLLRAAEQAGSSDG